MSSLMIMWFLMIKGLMREATRERERERDGKRGGREREHVCPLGRLLCCSLLSAIKAWVSVC